MHVCEHVSPGRHAHQRPLLPEKGGCDGVTTSKPASSAAPRSPPPRADRRPSQRSADGVAVAWELRHEKSSCLRHVLFAL